MTKTEYLKSLDRLGLPPHSNAAKAALGLEARQLARYASGETPITPMLERLIEALLKIRKTS